MEKWLTLYSDSIVHDDVSPLAAPRRAAFNPHSGTSVQRLSPRHFLPTVAANYCRRGFRAFFRRAASGSEPVA